VICRVIKTNGRFMYEGDSELLSMRINIKESMDMFE
jgi:hypothetical protein